MLFFHKRVASVCSDDTRTCFGTASALTEDGNLWLVGGLGPNWMFDGFTTEIIGEHYIGSAVVQWSIHSEFGFQK